MDNALTAKEKDDLCSFKEHNSSASYKELAKFCEKEFGKVPSSSQVSRILAALKTGKRWHRSGDDGKVVKRVREAKWPELEEALDLWFMQVCLPRCSIDQSCPAVRMSSINVSMQIDDCLRMQKSIATNLKSRGSCYCRNAVRRWSFRRHRSWLKPIHWQRR